MKTVTAVQSQNEQKNAVSTEQTYISMSEPGGKQSLCACMYNLI